MESDVYLWDTKEKQSEKKPYGFMDFPDNFLRTYRDKRSKIKEELDSDIPFSLQQIPYNAEQLESSMVFETSRVIDTLYGADSEGKEFTPLELRHFWRILKKADLRKLKTSYNRDFINVTKEILNPEKRALLSFVLSNYSSSRKQGFIQALSTSLKLNDALIAEIDHLRSPLERNTLSFALEAEAREVSRLEEDVSKIIPSNVDFEDSQPTSKHRISRLGMLLQEGNRTKAYLQALVSSGLYPNNVLLLRNPNYNSARDQVPTNRKTLLFNPSISEESTLTENNIPYQLITANSFNDPLVVETIRRRPEDYFVFSGSGILKEIFDSEKKIIHIHPGKLPEYRGSTCHFYSALAGDGWHCSAFFMNPGIDEGELILTKEFPLPGRNIDDARIYDPYTRSKTLVEVIKQLSSTGTIQTTKQDLSQGVTYYTIHPVLGSIRRMFFDSIE